MSSVNFIKSVGFKPVFDSSGDVVPGAVGDPVTVTFTYPKEVAPFQPAVTAELAGIRVTSGGSGYDPASLRPSR
jgi:hypothetical protein